MTGFFSALALVATFAFSSMAQAKRVECVADLPANNPSGLPVAWSVILDTVAGTALVDYSGGPSGGVLAERMLPNVIPTDEYVDGYDIQYFGLQNAGRDVRLMLAFRKENFKGGEMRFRIKRYPFPKGLTLLDSATAYCRPLGN